MKDNKGYILVLSLVIVTALFIYLGTITTRFVIRRKQIDYSYHRERALALAESGIDVALACLNEKNLSQPYPEISGTIPDMGTFLVTITSSTSSVTISSTGYSMQANKVKAQRTVEITASLTAESTVFDMALFAGSDTGTAFRKTGSGIIDSYDSEGTGKLYPNKKGNNGHIGTNSTSTSPKAVRITGSGDVDGNIYIGEGGNPDEAIQISGNVNVNGEKLTLSESRELPEVAPPSLPSLPDRGVLKKTGSSDEYVHESGRYSSISISGSGDLIFDNNANFIYVEGNFNKSGSGDIIVDTDMTLYVAGNLKFSGSGKLIIQNNHKLTIYVGGNITGTGGGFWNANMNPLNLVVYGLDTCTRIKLTGSSDFYGAIYARNAEIRVSGSGAIYGSVVGNTIKVTGSGDIHYDEALRDPNKNPGAPAYNYIYVVRRWKTVH